MEEVRVTPWGDPHFCATSFRSLAGAISGLSCSVPAGLGPAFHLVIRVCAALLVTGGLLAAAFVRTPEPSPGEAPEPQARKPELMLRYCPVDGPPLVATANPAANQN